MRMIKFIKKVLGFDLIKENRELREESKRNLSETERLLTLNGEETWMLNLCKTDKKGKKECFPDDK